MIPFSDRPAQHYFHWLHGEQPLETRCYFHFEHEYTVTLINASYVSDNQKFSNSTTVTKGALTLMIFNIMLRHES